MILALAATAALLLDHYRIHGYLFDTHDLLLRTESGLGFDSHEFFEMLFLAVGAWLAVRGGLSFRHSHMNDDNL